MMRWIPCALLLLLSTVWTGHQAEATSFIFPPSQTFSTGSIYPNTVAVDPSTGDYLLGSGTSVYRMDKGTGAISAGINLVGMPLGAFTGLVVNPLTGNWFVSDFTTILEYAPTGGSPIRSLALSGILGLDFDPSTGYLLGSVSGSTPNGQLLEFKPSDGSIVRTIDFVYPPRFGGWNLLQAYAFDPISGDHFSGTSDWLLEIPDAGGLATDLTQFPRSGLFTNIRGADFDDEGRLVLADRDRNLLYVLDRAAVPEPSALLLLGSGIAGLGGVAWRRHRRG